MMENCNYFDNGAASLSEGDGGLLKHASLKDFLGSLADSVDTATLESLVERVAVLQAGLVGALTQDVAKRLTGMIGHFDAILYFMDRLE